jgi:cephalosporin hydroxylase
MFGRVISEIFLEHIQPYQYMDEWHMKPFNGQVRRIQNICLITSAFKPDFCIETGTYLGTTTTFLAGLSNSKTFTFEINSKSASQAKKRFVNNYPCLDIDLITGNSAVELPKILQNLHRNKKIFVYLDSHWVHEVPTAQEINILNAWGKNWIAVIDDFKIDHDPGYGFDAYDQVEVGPEVVPRINGLEVWVPKEKSKFETGARRGTGYIFTELSIKSMNHEILQNLIKIR